MYDLFTHGGFCDILYDKTKTEGEVLWNMLWSFWQPCWLVWERVWRDSVPLLIVLCPSIAALVELYTKHGLDTVTVPIAAAVLLGLFSGMLLEEAK